MTPADDASVTRCEVESMAASYQDRRAQRLQRSGALPTAQERSHPSTLLRELHVA